MNDQHESDTDTALFEVSVLCAASSVARQGKSTKGAPTDAFLIHALSKKGVSQADAEKAVELVFKEGDSDGDQKSSTGLSKHSIDHLYAQASKQWLRGHDVPKETRKSRIIRWLQYRGFQWDVINFILSKLEKQDPHSAQ